MTTRSAENFNAKVCVADQDISAKLANTLMGARIVACDIETTGLDWRQSRIGTIQLYTPASGTTVVRTSTATEPLRLLELLSSDEVLKVFHHAPFDLGFIRHEWGTTAANVRCTKIASKLLHPTVPAKSHSLAPLVAGRLGITLNKGPVRTSDWTAQHLSDEQLEYAANDVRYLIPLLADLEYWLATDGKSDLYDGCCRFLPRQAELVVGGYPDIYEY